MPRHPICRNEIEAQMRAVRQGTIDRREFLAGVTSLGLATGAAYSLLGLTAPRRGRAQPSGGVIHCQMRVMALDDPRLFDWSEKANIARGSLENLVRYTNDFTLEPWLLQDWEVASGALGYTLHLRPDVRWSNGDAFTAADVIFNLTRWADSTVPGNSMAQRMISLVDPGPGSCATVRWSGSTI